MLEPTTIPHEILATVFEIGILTWDIRFLPPLRLVCHTWNEIVMTTPRLWGIISLDKWTDPDRLAYHISKAKHSPISIYVRRPNEVRSKALHMIVGLSSNWVHADVSTSMLKPGQWTHLRGTLKTLRLQSYGQTKNQAEKFFDTQGHTFRAPPRLRVLIAHSLVESWLLPFLLPSLTSFELHHPPLQSLSHTLSYLAKIPQITYLTMDYLRHRDHRVSSSSSSSSSATESDSDVPRLPLHFPNLHRLEIERTPNPGTLLGEIAAASLQILSIKDSSSPSQWNPRANHSSQPELLPLEAFFMTWSQPKYLPTNLRSLTLSQCLEVCDIASLIRWLARLPSLTNLGLHDDAIARAAQLPPSDEETNFFNALASSEGNTTSGGWICPSLTRLQLSMELQLNESLLPLLRARGSRSKAAETNGLRSFLHYLDAPLCPNTTDTEEIVELKGLVDEAICTCFGCEFNTGLSL